MESKRDRRDRETGATERPHRHRYCRSRPQGQTVEAETGATERPEIYNGQDVETVEYGRPWRCGNYGRGILWQFVRVWTDVVDVLAMDRGNCDVVSVEETRRGGF